jgi:hypothetical protein
MTQIWTRGDYCAGVQHFTLNMEVFKFSAGKLISNNQILPGPLSTCLVIYNIWPVS